jgi:hypothetical protein
VDARAIVRLEGLGQLKNAMNSSGIEPDKKNKKGKKTDEGEKGRRKRHSRETKYEVTFGLSSFGSVQKTVTPQ